MVKAIQTSIEIYKDRVVATAGSSTYECTTIAEAEAWINKYVGI